MRMAGPSTALHGMSRAGARERLEQRRKRRFRRKVFDGERSRCTAMTLVVAQDSIDRTRRFIRRPPRVQPEARRQVRAEAGVLDDRWLAGGEITLGAVAEPTAVRSDV